MRKVKGTSISAKIFAIIIAVAILGLCFGGLAACGHAHELKKVEETAATCTTDGEKAHWKCDGCDELFADADGTAATTKDALKIAAGHTITKIADVSATCTAEGNDEHWKCSGCNELFKDANGTTSTTAAEIKISAKGHKLVKVDAVAATCTTEGNKAYYKCSDCASLFEDAEGKTSTTLASTVIGKTAHDNELIVTVAGGTYIEGTKLTADKLSYSLKCDDCDDITAVTSGVEVDLSKELIIGANEFTAIYSGLSKKFTVTAVAKSITDITVSYTGKTVYMLNEQFDLSSLTVTAIYNNGKSEDVSSVCNVSFDSSTAGQVNAVVSFGSKTKSIALTILAKTVTTLIVDLNTPGKIFHVGETVKKSDLVVTANFDDNSSSAITDYTITTAIIAADTIEAEVSYADKTAKVSITVHDVVYNAEVPSDLTTNGTIAHYECTTCNKYYDEDFNEITSLTMPLMLPFSITDSKVSITNSDGTSESLKTESGHTFLAGTPSKAGYGRIFIKYNLSVEADTPAKLYLNMCTRTGDNKMNDVFSIKVNGEELLVSDDAKLPQAAANGWFAQEYAYAGNVMLYAGQNNIIEVTRLNLIYIDLVSNKGDYTYNFFGIGVTPYEATNVTQIDLCDSICEHCSGCTDETETHALCTDKCEGHENEHFCESACSICGDCTDVTCEDPACDEKCGCVEFSVMNDSVTVTDIEGATVGKNTKENNVSANDSSAKKKAIIITYTINSDVATTAKLFIKTCSQAIENTVADSYSFTVGGEAITVDPTLTMPYNEANKWNDIRYTYIGEIQLVAGPNTIVISRPDNSSRPLSDYVGYNFFGMALSTSTATVSFAS